MVIVALLLLMGTLYGESDDVEHVHFPDLGLTQVSLRNGLRICLKPTSFEEDGILIRLTAEGGYASQPPAQRAECELAMQIAWESGLKEVTVDQISALIYQYSMDIYAKVLPFHRIIEGTTSVDGVEFFCDLMKRYSLQHHFTLEGFDIVTKQTLAMLRERAEARCSPSEEWAKSMRCQDLSILKPLSIADLGSMDFARAKKFYEEYFANPSDYVCVIVGDFSVEKLLPILNKTLGSIPAKENPAHWPSAHIPTLPQNEAKRIASPGGRECLICLTYSLKSIKEAQEMRQAKLLAQAVESRLRQALPKQFGSVLGLAISVELPAYPSLDIAWLAIQYHCLPEQQETIQKFINAEIKQIYAEGMDAQELASCRQFLAQKEALWLKDNDYWLSLLSDYFLRGWPLQELVKMGDESSEEFKVAIQQLLQPTSYTSIATFP